MITKIIIVLILFTFVNTTIQPIDMYCALRIGMSCAQCGYDTVLINNICVPTYQLCKTYNGASCTSCQKGYILQNGVCNPYYGINVSAAVNPRMKYLDE
jgi:hypothetical protein